MRHTETPEEGNPHFQLSTYQDLMDAFWELIENHYEDEWRVEIGGAMTLVVDDRMLERILNDNVAVAWFKFGSNKGGWDENDNRYFTSRPEWLLGLWSIEGVYSKNLAYVGGPRTYHFEPGDY